MDFFLEGVEATALGAVDTARRLVALLVEAGIARELTGQDQVADEGYAMNPGDTIQR